MIENRHIERIVVVFISAAVIVSMLALLFSDSIVQALGGTGVEMEYESAIFDTSTPMEISISMDEDDWNDLLENAIDEEYYACDITINGTTVKNAGIRAKGNTSLSAIYEDDTTDRYSFKIEFDHYVDGQTFLGLDKLILNNNYADATNMKEAIVYDMYQFLDADASLYNEANITVNGSEWGVYLALEGVEDSFMLRNYGTSTGELYKPETMGGGAGGMKDISDDELKQMNGENDSSDTTDGSSESTADGTSGSTTGDSGSTAFTPPDMTQGGTSDSTTGSPPDMAGGDASGNTQGTPPDMTGDDASGNTQGSPPDMTGDGASGSMPGGMNSEDSGGADLNYIDDELSSYDTIWEGEVTSTGTNDHQRVVTALKNISEGNDLETYLDVDDMLKYLAVHTFAVNLDSLSGTMTHNYYLYESDGQLSLIPWDYNLSWGGFSGGGGSGGTSSATSTVNFAIDTPWSSGLSAEDREIFSKLLENETYKEQYHEYLQKLCDEYVNGGVFEATYNRIRSQIDDLVADDPTAFYTYDEYDTAAETLVEVIKLRAESISGQLDGTIPSTNEGQEADSSSLIDASSIDLSVMGTMNMGNQAGGGVQTKTTDTSADTTAADSTSKDTTAADGNTQNTQNTGQAATGGSTDSTTGTTDSTQSQSGPPGQSDGSVSSGISSTMTDNLIWYGVSAGVIAGGLGAAYVFKRRKRRRRKKE